MTLKEIEKVIDQAIVVQEERSDRKNEFWSLDDVHEKISLKLNIKQLIAKESVLRFYAISTESGNLTLLAKVDHIDEELGIDLTILLRALKYGIYLKDGYNSFKANGDKWFITSIENEIAYYHKQLNVKQFRKQKVGGMFGEDEYCPPEEVDKAVGTWNSTCVYFEDYGKTWALTKEELENDGR